MSSAPTKPESKSSTIPITPLVDANAVQLYLSNLNFSTTIDDLTKFFVSKNFKPLDVKIVMRKFRNQERSRGYGFIQFHKDQIKAILALDKSIVNDREMSIAETKLRTDEEREKIQKEREEKRDEFKKKRNAERQERQAADALNRKDEKKEEKVVEEVKPKYDNCTQLYVNNLPFTMKSEDLEKIFETATGKKPFEVDMVKSRFGKYKGAPRGFGFVYVHNDAVEKSLTINGTKIEEREIGVQVAKPKTVRNPSDRVRKPRRNVNKTGETNENGATTDGNAEGENGKARRPRAYRGKKAAANGNAQEGEKQEGQKQ